MPPILSDLEDSDRGSTPDMIPANAAAVTSLKANEEDAIDETRNGPGVKDDKEGGVGEQGEEEGEDDEEEEGDDDEFVVEKILSHKIDADGTVRYEIKWEGYSKKSDRTWEPVENLTGAKERLEEYHAKIGGTPQPEQAKPKSASKKRKSTHDASESPAPPAARKRGRKSEGTSNGQAAQATAKTPLPAGSWENHVTRVTGICQDTDGDPNSQLRGLLLWENGRKTSHPVELLRTKLPQKLIDYLLSNLVFHVTEEEE